MKSHATYDYVSTLIHVYSVLHVFAFSAFTLIIIIIIIMI